MNDEQAGSVGYPPEPWHLAGSGAITAWRVGVAALPALPTGVRPVSVRGRAVAVTAFVDYTEAGDMAYHELLAAVLVRHGRGVALSITDIWVDSEVSLAGGRGLWGIPKDLAEFDALSARDEHGPIASAQVVARRFPGPAVPLPRLTSSVAQTLDTRTVASPIRAGGRVRPARADWSIAPDGALGWLGSAHPLMSVLAEEFTMSFGTSQPAPAPS